MTLASVVMKQSLMDTLYMKMVRYDAHHYIQVHTPLQEETASMLLSDGVVELISNTVVLASLSVPFISK